MAGSGIALLQRWWNRLTLAGLVLCALVAPLAWWAGGTSWIAVVVGTLLLPLAAVAAVCALLGGRHRWLTRAAILATVIIPVLPLVGYAIPGTTPSTPGPPPEPTDTATVVALNTLQGRADAGVLARVAADADVVLLAEVAPGTLEGYARALRMRVVWSEFDEAIKTSTVILARDARVVSPRTVTGAGTPTGEVTIDGDRSDLRVIGTRLVNPAFQPPRLWDTGFRAIGARVEQSGPVVVLGDLNAPVTTIRYRRFVRDTGLTECADALGLGTPGTWSPVVDGRWAPLMIDHVLTRDARCESFDAPRIPGSDHRAVVATVSW